MKKEKKKPSLRPALLAVPFAALAFWCKYMLAGYGFSALVCLCIVALILFYTLMPFVTLRYPGLGKFLTRAVTVVLVLGLLVCGVTEALVIHASFGSPETPVEYVVVLGAKVRSWGPSVSLWDRINAAAEYLQAHPETVAVVSGGQGPDEPVTEASCMYEELVNLGIDPSRILVEDRAESTWENIRYSLDLIEDTTGSRPETLGVLSSEYHLFRASLFTRRAGVEFVGVPASTSRIGQKINHFMREVAGVWHYILLGGNYNVE